MVNKTTSFKKKGKGKKGKFKKNGKQVAAQVKKPKSGPKPETKCFYYKGTCDIHVIDVYLTSTRSNSWVFDTRAVAHICNSKRELQNKQRLVKGEVMMCVGSGSKIDMIIIAHSL